MWFRCLTFSGPQEIVPDASWGRHWIAGVTFLQSPLPVVSIFSCRARDPEWRPTGPGLVNPGPSLSERPFPSTRRRNFHEPTTAGDPGALLLPRPVRRSGIRAPGPPEAGGG